MLGCTRTSNEECFGDAARRRREAIPHPATTRRHLLAKWPAVTLAEHRAQHSGPHHAAKYDMLQRLHVASLRRCGVPHRALSIQHKGAVGCAAAHISQAVPLVAFRASGDFWVCCLALCLGRRPKHSVGGRQAYRAGTLVGRTERDQTSRYRELMVVVRALTSGGLSNSTGHGAARDRPGQLCGCGLAIERVLRF